MIKIRMSRPTPPPTAPPIMAGFFDSVTSVKYINKT
jgi:hypothetical protein